MTPYNFHQEEGSTKPDRYLWILETAYSIPVYAPTHTLGGKNLEQERTLQHIQTVV